jgi:hypothetical protein
MEEQRIDNMALLKAMSNVIVALLFERQRYFEFDKKEFSKEIFFKRPSNKGFGIIDDFNRMGWHQVCNNPFSVIRCKAFTYLQNLTNHLTVIRGSLYTASSCPGFFLLNPGPLNYVPRVDSVFPIFSYTSR